MSGGMFDEIWHLTFLRRLHFQVVSGGRPRSNVRQRRLGSPNRFVSRPDTMTGQDSVHGTSGTKDHSFGSFVDAASLSSQVWFAINQGQRGTTLLASPTFSLPQLYIPFCFPSLHFPFPRLSLPIGIRFLAACLPRPWCICPPRDPRSFHPSQRVSPLLGRDEQCRRREEGTATRPPADSGDFRIPSFPGFHYARSCQKPLISRFTTCREANLRTVVRL